MHGKDDIGRVYAAALFELARESEQVDVVRDDLSALAQATADEKEFLTLSVSPYFSRQDKSQLLQKLFAGRVTGLTMDFLEIANKHNRIMYLPLMAEEYEKLRDAYRGCRLVNVTLAKAMSDQEAKKLADEITASLKGEVKLEVRVDPSIIGGIIIRCGDAIVDNTIRRKLREAVTAITSSRKSQEKIHEV